jgi:choloylglycine hydrolase
VIINKRGVLKTAMPGRGKDPGQYARWTSKYGSLTFNQYGRETPMGGMNEAGLVIHMMSFIFTEYPEPDPRPLINSLQWIQYQLDNFSKVEEVISSDSQLRITPYPYEQPGLHFLVTDRTGDCASIEFLNGKLVYHTQETMPVKALANSTYAESVEFLKRHEGFGGKLPISNSESSLDRFVRAAKMLKNYDPRAHKSVVDYAFDILSNIAQASTMWSIVYDPQNLKVYFRTFSKQQIRYIDLHALDFSCAVPVKVLDINTNLSGNITNSFCDYTQQINRNLIRDAFRGTQHFSDVPDHVLDLRSRYPESTSCIE